MRIIKFKGQSKLDRKWIYGYLLGYCFIGNTYHNSIGQGEIEGVTEVWEDTVCQFTGLKDKNGKEIYFGDILQTSNDGIDGCDVWSKDDFGYTVCCEEEDELGVSFTKWHPSLDEESVYAFQYCEVIGNIHENPELLVPTPSK